MSLSPRGVTHVDVVLADVPRLLQGDEDEGGEGHLGLGACVASLWDKKEGKNLGIGVFPASSAPPNARPRPGNSFQKSVLDQAEGHPRDTQTSLKGHPKEHPKDIQGMSDLHLTFTQGTPKGPQGMPKEDPRNS